MQAEVLVGEWQVWGHGRTVLPCYDARKIVKAGVTVTVNGRRICIVSAVNAGRVAGMHLLSLYE